VFDLTLQQLIFRAAAFLVVVAIHGFALSAVALILGDRGPRYDGRLSLNPLVHLDMVGLASAILFQLGWIRPISIDPAHLRGGRVALIVCVLASLAVTIAAGVAAQWLRAPIISGVSGNIGLYLAQLVRTFGELSLWFAIINIVPLVPFTGAHLLQAVSPQAARYAEKARWPIVIAVVVLAGTGILTGVVGPLYTRLATLLAL
jgi:Zn-dependent protease